MTDSDPTAEHGAPLDGPVLDPALVRATYEPLAADAVAKACHAISDDPRQRLEPEAVTKAAVGVLWGLGRIEIDDANEDVWFEAVEALIEPLVERAVATIQQPAMERAEDPRETRERRRRVERAVGPERDDTEIDHERHRRERERRREALRDGTTMAMLGEECVQEIIALQKFQAREGEPATLAEEWTKVRGSDDWEDILRSAISHGCVRVVPAGNLTAPPRGMPRAAHVIVLVDEKMPEDLWMAGKLAKKAGRNLRGLDASPEWLRERYEAGRSIAQIAEEAGAPKPTVRRHLLAAGIEMRPRGGPRDRKVH